MIIIIIWVLWIKGISSGPHTPATARVTATGCHCFTSLLTRQLSMLTSCNMFTICNKAFPARICLPSTSSMRGFICSSFSLLKKSTIHCQPGIQHQYQPIFNNVRQRQYRAPGANTGVAQEN